MSYRESQRQKAIRIRDSLFRDPGNGLFYGKPREFVLQDPSLNLFEGIREDAKEYFRQGAISWWMGSPVDPTGHLLSSQISCLNHLYYIRQRKDIATAILKRVKPEIHEALVVDSGYVEFEYIGTKQYLNEKAFTRGANCTSVDAVMLGAGCEGGRTLFLIEWKYTENYAGDDLYIPARAALYDPLITHPEGRFIPGIEPKSFYFEPFYQMMRQTLLGWLFERNNELGCDCCINLHVIPSGNVELIRNRTSPYLRRLGHDIHEVWSVVLKQPEKYLHMDPEAFLGGTESIANTRSWLTYLDRRYWQA